MKLVLTNFAQDVSLVGDVTTAYLVLTDEESGSIFRLPVPQATATRVAQIQAGIYTGEPPLPTMEEAEEELEEEEPEPAPEPIRKRLVQPVSRIDDHQDEDGLPSL